MVELFMDTCFEGRIEHRMSAEQVYRLTGGNIRAVSALLQDPITYLDGNYTFGHLSSANRPIPKALWSCLVDCQQKTEAGDSNWRTQMVCLEDLQLQLKTSFRPSAICQLVEDGVLRLEHSRWQVCKVVFMTPAHADSANDAFSRERSGSTFKPSLLINQRKSSGCCRLVASTFRGI
eukprot:TRINITY_DN5752_c0_g1_i1.p1 TRINITY_DN5752_c0_g1~~TRINITY_DN5752_c0_g1_i1.p1  ORF type:complete len:177 (+),score=20.35 TRINITY_DN5752_c0_g1_i1:886-1416(+)